MSLRDIFEDEEEEALQGRFDPSAESKSPLDLPSDFEDEEIEEEDAWDDEDYAKFGNLSSGTGKGEKAKGKKVTLSESESEDEDEEDDDDGEGTLLAEMSKGDDAKESDEEEKGEGEDEEESYNKMMSTVLAAKETKKRTGREELLADPFLPESEYNVQPTQGKITLESLMGGLNDEVGFGDLKKKLERLDDGKSHLPAPLPTAAQDEIKRKVAYKNAKREVTKKWQATVIANRRAEHLSFPFNQPDTPGLSTAAIAQTVKPSTDLEKGIVSILQESGIEEEKIADFSDLAPKELTSAEVREREIQMRKMRNLLFYHELKMKRRAKIKSKAYHKILKKEKQRKMVGLDELEDLDEEAARREHEKLEKMRIMERATGRHRNKGNWAKGQLQRHMATESKQALSEQLRLGEQLLKKQNFMAGEEDSADELEALENEMERLDNEQAPDFPETGLLSMAFMQKGITKSEARARLLEEEADRKLLQAAGWNPEEDEDAAPQPKKKELTEEERKQQLLALTKGKAKRTVSDMQLSNSNQLEMVGLSAGRKVTVSAPLTVEFKQNRPKDLFEVAAFPDVEEDKKAQEAGSIHNVNKNKKAVEEIVKDADSKATKNKKRKLAETEEAKAAKAKEQNGKDASQKGKQEKSKKQRTEATVQEDKVLISMGNGSQLVKNKEQAFALKDRIENIDEDVDNEERIPLAVRQQKFFPTKVVPDHENPWMQQADSSKEVKKSNKQKESGSRLAKQQSKTHEAKQDRKERDVRINVDKVLSTIDLNNTTRKQHFDLLALGSAEQKELVRRAFANDDIMSEFSKEKEEIEQADIPKPPPALLGWGNWGGEGIRERRPKQQPKLQEPIRKGPPRKDKDLKHVILNERRDKKAAKFQAPEAPFPFKKPELYENAIRTPLGKHWNAQTVYEKAIEPRIKTKAGTVITPIEKPLPKEHKEVKKWATTTTGGGGKKGGAKGKGGGKGKKGK